MNSVVPFSHAQCWIAGALIFLSGLLHDDLGGLGVRLSGLGQVRECGHLSGLSQEVVRELSMGRKHILS